MKQHLLALALFAAGASLAVTSPACAGPVIGMAYFGQTPQRASDPNVFTASGGGIAIPTGTVRNWGSADVALAANPATGFWQGPDCHADAGFMGWGRVEGTKGAFDFTVPDAIDANLVANRKSRIYVLMAAIPGWSNGNGGCRAKPTNFQDFYDYVAKAAARYAGTGMIYETINEPDLTNLTAAETATIQQSAYQIIHAADSSATVLCPSLTATAHYYAQQFLAAGGGQYCDAFNFHPYPASAGDGTRRPEYLYMMAHEFAQDLAAAGLSGMPMWATEYDGPQFSAVTPAWASVAPLVMQCLADRALWYQADSSNSVGNLQGSVIGLSPSGMAQRAIAIWTLGAKITACPARQKGAAQVTWSIGGSPVAGSIPADCSSMALGTPPTGISIFHPDDSLGVRVAYLGSGTINGVNYSDFRACGTPGAGANGNITITNSAANANPGDYETVAANVSLVSGSLSNVAILLGYNYFSQGGSFLGSQSNAVYPNALAINQQTVEGMTLQVPPAAACAAVCSVRPNIGFQYTTGNYFDATIRVANLIPDQGTQWIMDLLRSDGSTPRISWDGAGGSTMSTSFGWYRKAAFGGIEFPVLGGSITNDNLPTITEAAPQRFKFP